MESHPQRPPIAPIERLIFCGLNGGSRPVEAARSAER